MDIKTNLLGHPLIGSRIGVLFLFIIVVCVGVSLVMLGAVAIIHQSGVSKEKELSGGPLTASSITSMSSNETANPSDIAALLDTTFAGALLVNGKFEPPIETPSSGSVALSFINPTDTHFPTTVEFPAQHVTIVTDQGTVIACTPRITGGHQLWVSKSGTTFFDATFTKISRRC